MRADEHDLVGQLRAGYARVEVAHELVTDAVTLGAGLEAELFQISVDVVGGEVELLRAVREIPIADDAGEHVDVPAETGGEFGFFSRKRRQRAGVNAVENVQHRGLILASRGSGRRT